MSSFVASQSSSNALGDATIENNGFWPDIDAAHFRQQDRLAGDIPSHRLANALTAAMADVNRQLADVQRAEMHVGVRTAAEMPLEPWQLPEHNVSLYRRAVYSLAHADLFERYRDHSATPAGDSRGEMRDMAADDLRRASRWAVAEIIGKPHSTVELI